MTERARIPDYEAEKRIGRAIRDAEDGGSFVIERAGRPVAVLLGYQEYRDLVTALADSAES